MLKKVALVFGAVFLLVGVLGFVPGATTYMDGLPQLFGVFLVGALNSAVYIATGVVGLLAASSQRYSKWYLQIFGLAYAVMALDGLLQGDTVLGVMQVNMADNLLHTVLAIGLLGAGFGIRPSGARTITMSRPSHDKPAM